MKKLVDTNLALYAADIAKQYKLAMADAIIYATSKKHNALLITSDKPFESLPNVRFLKKRALHRWLCKRSNGEFLKSR